MKQYYQYADDVLNGNIIVGEYIKLSCQRFKDDLANTDKWDFKEDKVDRAIRFISTLKHFKGKSSGQNFILEPWQEFIVANIIGFYHKGTNERKYTSSYIEVSRKNGKSCLAAALCIYFLIADGEDGAEVDLAANSREQANIAFEFCYTFAKQLDPKGKLITSKLKGITFKPNQSKLNVFAADASKLDGFNASFGLVDEYHSSKDGKVRDVIKSSMGMRRNPHLCTITTAGFDKTLPCYKLRTTCTEILSGLKQDDSMFVAIYCLDDNDEWTDESVWEKCSPNLDKTVTKKYIREQIQSALNNPSEEVGVKTKTLNIWCNSVDVWISDRYLEQATQTINFDDFKKDICFVGVDLAATSDLTAVSYMIPKDDKYYFKTLYYLPESCLVENSNKDLYKQWHRNGELILTNGNVTDYDYITNDLMRVRNNLRLYKIAFDSWNSQQWQIDALGKGLPLEPFSQSIGNFNKPTKEMERLIYSGKVVIDNNEITRWCFRNVELKTDWNENCLAIDTIVPTPNGNKTINDIQIGDYVFGSDGKPTKVVDVTGIHYNRDCYKLTFYNGAEVIADSTHRWYIETDTCKRVNKEKKCCQHYTYRDTEWIYNHRHKTRHTIMNGAVQYSEKDYSIGPYTLGQWLGDGDSNGSSFTCCGQDLHMYDYLKEKYKLTISKDDRARCPNTYNIYVKGGLRTELKNEGLLDNKHIPEEYFYGSVEQRLSLVQGLMDTDGTCNKVNGQCSFIQKNKDIAYGLHRLLNSLGIRNSIKVNKKGYYHISFYTNERMFRLDRKYQNQSKYKESNISKNNFISSIEKVDSVPTKCITVENDNHLFLITDDYLVTSNCKPTKGANQQKKIDGVIAMIQALGICLEHPIYSKNKII